ncbi:acylneuraminate cytidylyltransferase family protein [Moritella sp. 24]|uniref:acylneuraminate cytidylyltransferase family protein n=1 Tax=Moritella sp. 24 TaxID=2746230 RepID=UPI001BAA83E1|nr:acylneuraminate cytidylyltransferase family protein [Moritella sp. 24]QUM77866.1 acylneuraminate cytidylyltransferase family protein [Moritella sp. 24]
MNIALITARGGSKGLPRKNILPLNDKPLISWTIQAALNSSCIDEVYVTTEDLEIADISVKYGAKVIPRPNILAQDETSSEPVIAQAINYLSEQNYKLDKICLLQPTSPLRTAEHINAAFQLFEKKKAFCVLSVFEPQHSAAKAYKVLDDGSITGLIFDDAPYCRRQDLPNTYQPNGGIYLFDAEQFMLNEQIPRKYVFPLIMTEEESIDIDTAADLQHAELIMKGKIND